MDVTFDCAGRQLVLPERAARTIEERLRQLGDGRIGLFVSVPPMMAISTAVADAIDQGAAGALHGAIPLEGQVAEAVYQAARTCRFEPADHLAGAALLDALYHQRLPAQ